MIKKLLVNFLNNPVRCFLLLAIPVGLISIFLIPPLAGNDEISHFSRAYEVAGGQMITKKIDTGNYGGKVPFAAIELYQSNGKFDPLKIDLSGIASAKNKAGSLSINNNDKTQISYSGSALYSPVSYIPHSISIIIAEFLNLSILQTIYLIRIVVFILYLILVSLAIFVSPIKKWLFFAVGTMPMSLLLAGNITTDGLVIGTSILITSILIKIIVDRKTVFNFGKRTISLLPLLCVLSIYFAFTKAIYSPLLVISAFALTKVYKFKSTEWVKWVLLTVVLPIGLMLAWNIGISKLDIDSGQRLSVNSVGIYPPTKDQAIHDVLTQPLQPVKIFIHTFIDSYKEKQDIPNYILSSFSGKFTEYRISPANWLSVSVILSLIFAFSLEEEKKYGFSKRLRLYTLTALLIGLLGVMASMYLYATSRGALVINGIQGRYFIPFIPFFIFLVSSNRLFVLANNNKTKLLLVTMSIINVGIMVWLISATFL